MKIKKLKVLTLINENDIDNELKIILNNENDKIKKINKLKIIYILKDTDTIIRFTFNLLTRNM